MHDLNITCVVNHVINKQNIKILKMFPTVA